MVEKIMCASRDREQAVMGGILEWGGYIRRRKGGEWEGRKKRERESRNQKRSKRDKA